MLGPQRKTVQVQHLHTIHHYRRFVYMIKVNNLYGHPYARAFVAIKRLYFRGYLAFEKLPEKFKTLCEALENLPLIKKAPKDGWNLTEG